VQEKFEGSPAKGTFKVSKLVKALKKTSLDPSSPESNAKILSQAVKKKVTFAPSVPVIQVSQHGGQPYPSPDPTPGGTVSSPRLIQDLCSFLRDGQALSIGIIIDESDR
jgi:hypothetical protein